jgi:hypothetical protein
MIKEAVESNTNLLWREDDLKTKYAITIPKSRPPKLELNDEQVAALYYGAVDVNLFDSNADPVSVRPRDRYESQEVQKKRSKQELAEAIARTRAGDVKEKLSDSLFKLPIWWILVWWILEFCLLVERKQGGDGSWVLKPQ